MSIIAERAAAHLRYDGPLPAGERRRLEDLARRRPDMRQDCRHYARIRHAMKTGATPPVIYDSVEDVNRRYRACRAAVKAAEREGNPYPPTMEQVARRARFEHEEAA